MLGEFYRITKPAGLIGIIDLQGNETPRFDRLLHVLEMLHDPTHVRSYTANYWRGLIQNGGCEIVTMETGLSEKPGGITVRRWCQIAKSGPVAEAAINEVLRWAAPEALQSLGIEERDGEFFYPVRSCLIVALKRA
jgi:hypothetical protein